MADATCKHPDGCPKPARTNGWCDMHYQRVRKTGDPGPAGPRRHDPGTVICSIPDCGDLAKARGWCGAHYQKWHKYGDPLFVVHIQGDDEARFWSKVNKDGPTPERRPDLGPCWLWTGPTNDRGYGRFSVGCQEIPAHRYAAELKTGPIPDGYEPDHLCFNPSCVNNESHLEVVTQRENILRSTGPAAINAAKAYCINNHEFTTANTRLSINEGGNVRRTCRECARNADRRHRAKVRAQCEAA